MTKRLKKIITALLVLTMVFVMVPGTAMATTTYSTTTAVDGLTASVDTTNEYLTLTPDQNISNKYSVDSTVTGYYPQNFSLIVNDRTKVSSITVSNNGSFSWGYDSYDSQTPSTTTNYGLVTLPEGSTSTVTITTTSNHTITLTCSAPVGGANATGGATLYAFMPAAGQFVNEGMGSGGWGDPYDASGNLKNIATTGMSLGYFGGSAVYYFGANGITNSYKNPFGVDFIVYGNAFWNNSEPGQVQVSEGHLVDGVYVPSTWYDLASSEYYTEYTTKGVTITYTNPTTNDDVNNTSTKASVPYSISTSSQTDLAVNSNNFHNHSYFPLNRFYFQTRTINSKSCPAIDKDTELTFYSYSDHTTGIGSTLQFTNGTLFDQVARANAYFTGSHQPQYTIPGTFGFADYYPVKTLGSAVAYNPYATSTQTSSSTFNTFLNTAGIDENGDPTEAGGGEPMDISWAVDSNGTPVNLTTIRFVRVYTAPGYNNGINGELSTEVRGVVAAQGITSVYGVGTTDYASITATYGNPAQTITQNDSSKIYNVLKETTINVPSGENTATITVNSTAAKLLIKDTASTSGSSFTVNRTDGTTQYFRIIAQGSVTNSKAQASIIVLKVVFQ